MNKFSDFFSKNKKVILVFIVIFVGFLIFKKLFMSRFGSTTLGSGQTDKNNYPSEITGTNTGASVITSYQYPDPAVNTSVLALLPNTSIAAGGPNTIGVTGWNVMSGTGIPFPADTTDVYGTITNTVKLTTSSRASIPSELSLLQLFLSQPVYKQFMFNTQPVTPVVLTAAPTTSGSSVVAPIGTFSGTPTGGGPLDLLNKLMAAFAIAVGNSTTTINVYDKWLNQTLVFSSPSGTPTTANGVSNYPVNAKILVYSGNATNGTPVTTMNSDSTIQLSLYQAIAIPANSTLNTLPVYGQTTGASAIHLNFQIARTNIIGAVLNGIHQLFGNAPGQTVLNTPGSNLFMATATAQYGTAGPYVFNANSAPSIQGYTGTPPAYDGKGGIIGDLTNNYSLASVPGGGANWTSSTIATYNSIQYTPNVKNAVWAYVIARDQAIKDCMATAVLNNL